MTGLLQVEGLGKRFGGFVALDGIQLEVKEGERSHREVAATLHRHIDVLHRRGSHLVHADRVVEIWEEQCVHDESRTVKNLNWIFATSSNKFICTCNSFIACSNWSNYFNKWHKYCRVEKVNSAYFVRTICYFCHFDYGKRAGICCQNRFWFHNLVKLFE